jgi:hypothetical protein
MYSVIPIVQGAGVIKGDGAVLPQEGRYHAKKQSLEERRLVPYVG